MNNHLFAVGENLYSMLWKLAKSFEVHQLGLKVWIDAICINQGDAEEKEVEVQKMGWIYKKALAVRAWLGPSPTASFSVEYHQVREWLNESPAAEQPHQVDTPHPSGRLGEAVRAVEHAVFSNPFWDRIWILQEITLASSILFWYGDCYFTPNEISWLINHFTPRCIEEFQSGAFGLSHIAGSSQASLRLRFRSDYPRSKDIALRRLVGIAKASKATDARDKVYGMLALIPESIAANIRPSYASHYAPYQAYAALTRAYILDTGDLRIWYGQVSLSIKGDDPLPSWALDLYAEQEQYTFGPTRLATISTENWSFGANGARRGRPTFSDNGLIMSCPGIFADSVQSLAKPNSEANAQTAVEWYFAPQICTSDGATTLPSVDASTKSTLARVLHRDSDYQYPAQGCLLDLAWGLDADRPPDGPNWKRLRNDLDGLESASALASLAYFRSGLHANANFLINGVPLRAYFDASPGTFAPNHKTAMALGRISQSGRLCMTAAGRVAMVPDETEVGDRIAVLFACEMPVIIRPRGKHYQLIGCSFVDGLMKGEALGLRETTISFC